MWSGFGLNGQLNCCARRTGGSVSVMSTAVTTLPVSPQIVITRSRRASSLRMRSVFQALNIDGEDNANKAKGKLTGCPGVERGGIRVTISELLQFVAPHSNHSLLRKIMGYSLRIVLRRSSRKPRKVLSLRDERTGYWVAPSVSPRCRYFGGQCWQRVSVCIVEGSQFGVSKEQSYSYRQIQVAVRARKRSDA